MTCHIDYIGTQGRTAAAIATVLDVHMQPRNTIPALDVTPVTGTDGAALIRTEAVDRKKSGFISCATTEPNKCAFYQNESAYIHITFPPPEPTYSILLEFRVSVTEQRHAIGRISLT